MARLFTQYEVKVNDDLADPSYWNSRWESMDVRVHKLENDFVNVDETVAELIQVGLTRLDTDLTPIIVEAQERLGEIGLAFAATANGTNTVGTGSKSFVIEEGSRATFMHTGYATFYQVGVPANYMHGEITLFNRATGDITITSTKTGGSGTFAAWTVRSTGPTGPQGIQGIQGEGSDADDVVFNNVASGLIADDVQAAIDELVIDIAASNAAASAAQTTANNALPKAGGIMTGHIVLHATSPIGTSAVNKTYVDGGDTAVGVAFAAADANRLSIAGVAATPSAADAKTARDTIYASPLSADSRWGLQVNGFMGITQNIAIDTDGTSSDHNIADNCQFTVSNTGGTKTMRLASSTAFTSRRVDQAARITAGSTTAMPADGWMSWNTNIEGFDCRGLHWGTAFARPVTFAVLVRANHSGTYSVFAANADLNRAYCKSFAIVANTDTWVSITIPGDTSGTWSKAAAAIGIRFGICLGVGTDYDLADATWTTPSPVGPGYGVVGQTNFLTNGNVFSIGPYLIMPGTEAPREDQIDGLRRPATLVAHECNRYFWKTGTFNHVGYAAAGNFFGAQVMWPAEMFSTPSISFVSPTYGNASTIANGGATNRGAFIRATATALGACSYSLTDLRANARMI